MAVGTLVYRQLGLVIIDATDRTPAEVAAELAQFIHSVGRAENS